MDQDVKHLTALMSVFALCGVAVLLIHWGNYTEIFEAVPIINTKLQGFEKIFFLKLLILGCVGIGTFFSKVNFFSSKKKALDYKDWLGGSFVILFFLFSYTGISIIDKYLYVPTMMLSISVIVFFVSMFSKKTLKDDTSVFGINTNKETEENVSLIVIENKKKEELTIKNPFQGIYVDGGAGAGKSASVIEPLNSKFIMKNFAAYIYDFKGNPPTLGRAAYNAWYEGKMEHGITTEFNIFSVSQPHISCQLNPLNPIYFNGDSLKISAATQGLLLNLNPDWIKKPDFWFQNALSLTRALVEYLIKYHPNYATIPHLTLLILEPIEKIIGLLKTDKKLARNISAIITAVENEAGNQVAGLDSSLKLPFTLLHDKDIFWAFNPIKKYNEKGELVYTSEVSLNINNPKKPQVLVICNDTDKQLALSPLIALCTNIIKTEINNKNKHKCLFSIDELPTQYIMKLEELPATGRSNKIVTLLGLQDFSQLVLNYGKEQADVILSNMGNQFNGMTNNSATAERIAKQIGKFKKVDYSYSQDTSRTSQNISEKLQLEDVIQARDIMGQPVGFFTGKIANGDPPFFHNQLDLFSLKYDKEVPYKISPDKSLKELIEKNYNNICREVELILKSVPTF